MKAKSFTVLLMILFFANTLGLGGFHGDHHNIGNAVHEYFHSVGQPHTHAEDDEVSFEIGFSDEAFAHVDALDEAGSTVYFVSIPNFYNKVNSSGLIVSKPPSATSPYIQLTSPPPKHLAI